MTISIAPLAVLFDADGVLQSPAADWQARLVQLAGAGERAEEFLADVFAAEAPCLLGTGEFETALSDVLARWNSPCAVADALEIWTRIEADREALAVVAQLRSARVRCYLTTNQHELRARQMSEVLGYAAYFDREFYSCRLGHAKPSAEFFGLVLDAISLPASRVLFIDDHLANVAAARAIGMQATLFEYKAGAEMLRCALQQFRVQWSDAALGSGRGGA
jgi:putative hydrolase of the HAD superfamily